MGSRSKGPRRDADTLSFAYYRALDAGPVGESKLDRRIRRSRRETFSTGLAKEFAVGAQSRHSPPRRQIASESRQEPLRRAKTLGTSQRVAKLFRRVVGRERLLGLSTTVDGLTGQWARLNHRQRGRYRRELERRGAVSP